MKVNVPFAGDQEIAPDTVITFPQALPGFPDCQRFKLFHEEGKPTIFWLQSLDDASVSFSVALPDLFHFIYELSLTEEDQALLQLKDAADAVVMLLLYKPVEHGERGDYSAGEAKIYANINAPLVINIKERIGMQKTLSKLEELTLLRAS